MRTGAMHQGLDLTDGFDRPGVFASRPPGPVWLIAGLTGVGYYLGTKVGFALTFQPHAVSTLWPPNAVLLAALLLTAPRYWWLVLLAAFPAHLLGQIQGSVPTLQVLAWFASNCSEALIGASCIWYVRRAPLRLKSFGEFCGFIGFGALLAPFLSSFLDIGLLKLIGWGQGEFWSLWEMRFFSNVLASILLVPLILVWRNHLQDARAGQSPAHVFEAVFVVLCVLIVSAVVFKQDFSSGPDSATLFVMLPFLLWAAVRLGVRGTSMALLIVAVASIWAAIHGRGPFVAGSPDQSALTVQMFLIVISIPLLLLAAIIEERGRTQDALRSSEERFAKAFHSSPDAMAILRLSDGHVIDVNDRWQLLFGYSRQEAIGRTTTSLGLFDDVQTRAGLAARIEKEEHLRDLPLDLRTKYGTALKVLMTAEKTEMEGMPCVISILRDVTEQRRVEQEAAEQRRHMTHLTRVAVLGQLSGALAHELNQPLTAILSNAQAAQRFLMREEPDLDELRDILKDIVADDKRAGEVIRRLRALLGRGETQLDHLNVNDIVEETLTLMHGELVARHVSLHTEYDEAVPEVMADRVQLQQVLLNLILNATEAMSEKPSDERVLTVRTACDEAGRAKISVSDSGTGIAPELLDTMFQPFFTTKEQGMGLGLSISRNIILAHAGALWAERNPEVGATLHIQLPACHAEENSDDAIHEH